jgi:hypothetical protein
MKKEKSMKDISVTQETTGKAKSEKKEPSWEDYGRTEKPHFSNCKDWLKKIKEIKHGNINECRMYLCERCEGVYVNYLPMNACEGIKDGKACGNDDQEIFKEITGEMRQFLLDGGDVKKILSYSYTFS